MRFSNYPITKPNNGGGVAMKTVNHQIDQTGFNPIQAECDKVYYSPKSKFHVDFLWQSYWFKQLHCPRQAFLLQQILYFTQKQGSVFSNGKGDNHQGMLINFSDIESKSGFSRKVVTTALNHLEAKGYIVRFTLKNNRVLYQATDKAVLFLEEAHQHSLAANADENDYDAISKNFENIRLSAPSFTQTAKQASPFGQGSINKVNNQKVNKKNNTLNNQYQTLERVGSTKNVDCEKTVIFSDFSDVCDVCDVCDFDFSDFGIRAVKCESKLFDYLTVSQAKVINIMTHVNADQIDIIAFNNALARKDIKREAKDFKQFIDWCYLVAVDAKGASSIQGSMTVGECDVSEYVVASDKVNLGKVDTMSDNGNDNDNHHNNRQSNLDLDLDFVINELKAILTNESIEKITAKVTELNEQYDIDTESELVAAILVDFGVISDDEFLAVSLLDGSFVVSDLKKVVSKRSLTGSNNIDRCNAVKADTASNKAIDQVYHSVNCEVVDGVSDDGKGIKLPENTTSDSNDQQNINADNMAKDTETVVDEYLNLGESKYKNFIKQCIQRGYPSESEVVRCATHVIQTYGKLNYDQLFRGICYGDFHDLKRSDHHAFTDISQDKKQDQARHEAKNRLLKNPNLKLPPIIELAIPVIEQEVLKKDWASLAQQDLVKGTVTECQKVALVAIIDYVKRKGVVISSEQEVYQWLYHTVANYTYYFSGATSFKHLANMLIKQLIHQCFNRPSGFDNWYRLVCQKSQDKITNRGRMCKTNNSYYYMRH